jgi:hypothetical protein
VVDIDKVNINNYTISEDDEEYDSGRGKNKKIGGSIEKDEKDVNKVTSKLGKKEINEEQKIRKGGDESPVRKGGSESPTKSGSESPSKKRKSWRSSKTYVAPVINSNTTPYSSSSESSDIYTSPYGKASIGRKGRVTLQRTRFVSLVRMEREGENKDSEKTFLPPPGITVGNKGLSWMIRMIRLLIDDKQLVDMAADRSKYLTVRPKFPLFGM